MPPWVPYLFNAATVAPMVAVVLSLAGCAGSVTLWITSAQKEYRTAETARRAGIIEEITIDFLNKAQREYPDVKSRHQKTPPDFVNAKLKERGEDWTVPVEIGSLPYNPNDF